MGSALPTYAWLGLVGVAVAFIWRALRPKPYPGIPYNAASAARITGDIPELISAIKGTNEFTTSLFTVTTRRLGTPIAQLLFPGIRQPLIVLDDPREVEDIIIRRGKEFDKGTLAIDTFGPMFPQSMIARYTTPDLRVHRRQWMEVMNADFLRKAVIPNVYRTALDLIDLWRLKASTLYKDQPFEVHEDLKNDALDAIWVSLVGEEPGLTRFEMQKLQHKIAGKPTSEGTPPMGAFIKEEVTYIGETIATNSNSVSPKWSLKLEMLKPRYRRFRANIDGVLGRMIKQSLDRTRGRDVASLESDDSDTCALDLVIRRQVLHAKEAGTEVTNLDKDRPTLDELFMLFFGGHDSAANSLAWFSKFMGVFPTVQTELRNVLKAAFPGPGLPSADEILDADSPYLECFIQESVRLSGTTNANIRQATVDTEVLGCPIPKGAQILINFHVNRPPATVAEAKRSTSCQQAAEKLGDGFQGPAGRDLGTFEPRRWMKKDEKTGKEVFDPHAIPFLGFGGGYRGCFGRKLGYMEFRIMVVLLILSFEFLPLPEDLAKLNAHERIFRYPHQAHAKLRIL